MYKDGTRNYVLYGPLALVQHADVSDVVLGRPMLGFDWVLSVGSKLYPAPGLKTIREIRLRGEGRGAEARLRPVRGLFRSDEEVRMNYDGGVSGADEQEEEVECVRDTRQPEVGKKIAAREAGGLSRSRTLRVENEDERMDGVRVATSEMPELSVEASRDEPGGSESDNVDEEDEE